MDLKIKKQIDNVKCFLLDMDGTIYLDNVLFDKVIETLEKMKEKRRIIFLTNNSSKSGKVYIEKLKKLGIVINKDEIYTSGEATIEYIKTHLPNKSCYVLGTNALVEEFKESGITINEDNPDFVVLGYDSEITYSKLCKFTNFLHEGKYYIATHPDINCPASPYFVVDIGAMMKMIEASTNRTPDLIIGKPYVQMGQNIMDRYHLKPNEVAMIGDRLYTDIRFGSNNGFVSILVYSGETTKEDYKASDIKASIELDKISDIIEYL